MAKDIKPNLEEIANSLTVPELERAGYMYIPVIKKGVADMSNGRIVAEPLSESVPIAGVLHYDYALFYEGTRIGQFRLHVPGQAMVSAEDLRNGVEIALRNHPKDMCVQIDPCTFDLGPGKRCKGEKWEPTQYDHVFLGPALPATYKVHKGF